MKIPFDIKFRSQIESGEYKVETRDGKPARIICWDKKEYKDQREQPTPIVYLITSKGGCEHIMSCTTTGMYSDGLERDYDLFIVIPEPELSEFEKELSRCLCDSNVRPGEEDYDKWAKEYAPALLALARKELSEQIVDHTKEAYENGKAEALKGLPRWKKAYDHCFVGPAIMRDEFGFYHASTTKPGCRYITYASLSALPGFKED